MPLEPCSEIRRKAGPTRALYLPDPHRRADPHVRAIEAMLEIHRRKRRVDLLKKIPEICGISHESPNTVPTALPCPRVGAHADRRPSIPSVDCTSPPAPRVRGAMEAVIKNLWLKTNTLTK